MTKRKQDQIEHPTSVVELIDKNLKSEKIAVPDARTLSGKLILCQRLKQHLEVLITASRRKGYEQCAQSLTQHMDGIDQITDALGAASSIVRSLEILQGKAT